MNPPEDKKIVIKLTPRANQELKPSPVKPLGQHLSERKLNDSSIISQ